ATVKVTALTDPFAGYDPSSPPDRGFHFVLLVVTIANTGSRPYEANPGDFSLVDTDGFVYGQGNLYRGSHPTPPDLRYQHDLAPGAEATGAIGFRVLKASALVQVVYTRGIDRPITLVDRRTDLPALGDTVPFIGTEGTEAGRITITDLADPFSAYAPSSPPR